jgi:predicted nucleotidyltransferase component of viral defense system
MCKSMAEAGQGCATHTHRKFEQATFGTEQWWQAASEHASTPEGHELLEELAQDAHARGDIDRQTALRAALLRGETMREAAREAARQMNGRRRSLARQEIEAVAREFDVATVQVARDHAISHVLGILAGLKDRDRLTFFGGTALSRTFLPTLRLSEDIDLITHAPRTEMARQLERAVARGLSRSHGAVSWDVPLSETTGSQAAVLQLPEGARIRIQLLSAEGCPAWPVEERTLIQRYSDAPAARLRTFTAPAFAASKTGTWLERKTPRDLYDLWALGQHGYIAQEALALFERHGPTGGQPQPWMFADAPSSVAWQRALGHQGRIRISPDEALTQVRSLWLALADG